MDAFRNFVTLAFTGQLTWLALISVFVSVMLLVFGAMLWLWGGLTPIQRRLKEIAEGAALHDPTTTHREGMFEVRWVAPVARILLPKEEWKQSRLRWRLVRAGYRSSRALNIFLSTKIALAFVIPLFIILPALVLGRMPSSDMNTSVTLLVLSALFGFYLPDVVVIKKSRDRQLSFIEGFPDAMDMLVVCVEAGLGLDAAIQRVGSEMMVSHPDLATEFSLVSLELRAGKSRDEALRSLADRTGVEEVRSLISILIQSEHFGTSVAQALREHATEMRTLRIQKAKERAAKLPVKLIFPIMFFIFPALFLVILAPALVRIYTGFIQTMGGG